MIKIHARNFITEHTYSEVSQRGVQRLPHFRISQLLHYSGFTYQVPSFTTRQLNFINHLLFLPSRNMEVTLFDNNIMATINKLRNQYKGVDLASICKELTKHLELNNFTENHLNRINVLLLNGKIIDKPNRNCLSYLLNENISSTFDHVYEPELLETQLTLLNSLFSAPVLDEEIETTTVENTTTTNIHPRLF